MSGQETGGLRDRIAEAERDDYAARLKATDRSWSELARERDRYRLAWQSARQGRAEARDQKRRRDREAAHLIEDAQRARRRAEAVEAQMKSTLQRFVNQAETIIGLREAEKRVRDLVDTWRGTPYNVARNDILAALDQPETP